jgi:3-oxoacyl-(acyl-carrier-protein) synthase
MNFQAADPQCAVDCVPNQGRPAVVDYVVNTASAFGGNNSAILFKRWFGE